MEREPDYILDIDADYAPYAFGNYPEFDAIIKTDLWIQDILERLGTRAHLLFLSGKGNFRYDVAFTKPYKGNRKDKEKPRSYDAIRKHLQKKANCITVHGMEADDAILIYMHRQRAEGRTPVCVSDDKDMLQECGYHFRHSKNMLLNVKSEILRHAKAKLKDGIPVYTYHYMCYGEFMWLQQMLIGDTADNIPGIRGIGERHYIFDHWYEDGVTVEEAKVEVMLAYIEHYGTNAIAVFIEQYRLLHLIRNNHNI